MDRARLVYADVWVNELIVAGGVGVLGTCTCVGVHERVVRVYWWISWGISCRDLQRCTYKYPTKVLGADGVIVAVVGTPTSSTKNEGFTLTRYIVSWGLMMRSFTVIRV